MVRSYGTSAVGPCDGSTMVAVDMALPSVSNSLPARPAAQDELQCVRLRPERFGVKKSS